MVFDSNDRDIVKIRDATSGGLDYVFEAVVR